ncbi:MAG TPA: hypothetical protein VK203_11500 [Nostocaceae cyanobacterium]|nr:hypothetical protein [Nostocaceae cyanobacterium]
MLKPSKRRNLWFEKIMAITATINIILVFFDLSYIPWRDFYFRRFPQVTQIYDPVKGIELHRDTTQYLQAVQQLKIQVAQKGLESSQVKNQLNELNRLSAEMINTNPFALAGKSGTLEKIKNLMRERVKQDSAKKAFAVFWSQDYLLKNRWDQEITFFQQQVEPLIATNYFRKIGENGEFWDDFWKIDALFIALFAIELLGRIIYIKLKHRSLSWIEALLWRWYDIFLLIPLWRWLRVLPVLVRLDQAQLVNFYVVRKQIHQGIVANFAEEITEIVVVRVINQIQGSIKRGEITRWLLQKENVRPYIDINDVNEVEAIATLLVQTIINQVIPNIQPEAIALLRHNIDSALQQVPVYRNLSVLPGVGQAQTQLSEQLATQITTSLYSAILTATKDPIAAKLSGQLIEKFTAALGSELQKKQVLAEIQSLLVDFLEEVKLNYVQRLSQEDIDQIIEQTRQMRKQTAVNTLVEKRISLPEVPGD